MEELLCVVDEVPVFLNDLKTHFSGYDNTFTIRTLSLKEGIEEVTKFFEEEQFLTRKVHLLALGPCIALLEKIPQLLGACLSPVKDAITIVKVIDIKMLLPTLEGGYSSLSAAYCNRSTFCEEYDVYSSTNELIDLAQRKLVRFHILPHGLLYGNSGYHLKNLFREVFVNNLQPHQIPKSLILPTINIRSLLNAISNVLKMTLENGKIPLVIPGFDNDSLPFRALCTEINQKINNNSPNETEVSSNSNYQYVNEIFKCDMKQYNINRVLSSLSSSAASTTNIVGEGGILRSFEALWSEYLSNNGMKPIRALVVGPPSSGKSYYSRELATKLQVPVVNIYNSILFVVGLQTDFVSGQDSDQELKLFSEQVLAQGCSFPTNIDPKKLIGLRNEVITALETKLSEGVKKGKDKAVQPTEPVKINPAQITEAISQALDINIIRKAIALQLTITDQCQKRGFVMDIWDKFSVFSAAFSLPEVYALTSEDGTDTSSFELHFVIELQCEDKPLIQKVTSRLEQQNLKPKDLQAQVKAFEALLNSYNAQVTAADESETAQPTHREVINLLNRHTDISVLRRNFEQLDLSEVIQEYKSQRRKQRGEVVIGWIEDANLSHTSSAGKEPEILIQTDSVNDKFEPTATPSKPTVTNENTNSSVVAPSQDVAAQRAEKINTFLSDTVLPIIANAFVKIMREKPEDPIEYMAKFLADESNKNQMTAFENTKNQFYQLLES